eukprot:CAMPEP_0173376954 /NCGR_PEP_ID=MMETSP1356-20130122/100_1 /TAXON_ID=77927 ORGANISM="Hemiselmis virescens, Strain PCC157" /NCGR_SAMPLE_ID=MMETSP1356 /ASSEMBLY_ACC=CAM_ASM_000847 /LENGTH=147 /DNA_ID=CAMNT_0014329523 /DNA_START=32 /DNA_END=475 /DNA_ORIENTATION=-
MLSTKLLLLSAIPAACAFSAPAMPLRAGASGGVSLRTSAASSIKMAAIDPAVVQGGLVAIAGTSFGVGFLWLIENQGVKSAERMDEVQLTKLNAKIDGGEAENKFSGSDQSIDDLIAAMDAAQGGEPKPKVEAAAPKAKKVDDDDGW